MAAMSSMINRILPLVALLFMHISDGLTSKHLVSILDDGPSLSSSSSSSFKISSSSSSPSSSSCAHIVDDKAVSCRNRKFESVPDDLPPDIERLDLSYNSLLLLLNHSFASCTHLLSLDLSYNNILYIQATTFSPLELLEQLYLSHNHFLPLNIDTFKPLRSLSELWLDSCGLRIIPNSLLEFFPRLQHLHMSHNKIRLINITSCGENIIENVFLLCNNITALSVETFTVKCRIKTVDLTCNPIQSINDDSIAALPVEKLILSGFGADNATWWINLFNGIGRSVLVDLILYGMPWKRIPAGIFESLRWSKNFTSFECNECDIETLHLESFSNVTNMEIINFVANRNLRMIDPKHFAGLQRLRKLTFFDCSIEQINPNKSAWSNDLEELDLGMNHIRTLESYQLKGLFKLEILYLSANKDFHHLELASFDGQDSLKELHISWTNIQKLNLKLPKLGNFFITQRMFPIRLEIIPGKLFEHCRSLVAMNMSLAFIDTSNIWNQQTNESLFHGLLSLTLLDLSSNPLQHLPSKTFEQTTSLQDLYLQNCELSSLTGYMFTTLRTLEYLDLKDNRILYIEDSTFFHVLNLSSLNLANNQLVGLNSTLFDVDRDHTISIDLSGNPIACECNMKWLRSHISTSIELLHTEKTICSLESIHGVRGQPIVNFEPRKYCSPNISAYCTIVFGVIGFFIVLLLTYYNRWFIRYKIFLIKLFVVGYKEMQDDRERDEFEFDFNIMFTDADEQWARDRLRPSLEEWLPDFDRYSFGDDDLTLGMHYLDAVHYAIVRSFKTVVVVSRAAVQDNWFLIKFRTAIDHVNDGGTESIVVIFVEDIPDKEIPFLVRLYLSDRRPCLTWSEDVRGHEYFWNKLVKSLTVNLKHNPLVPPE